MEATKTQGKRADPERANTLHRQPPKQRISRDITFSYVDECLASFRKGVKQKLFTPGWSDEGYVDVVGPQRIDSRTWQVAVGDEVVNGAGRNDPRQTTVIELTRIAHHHYFSGGLHHGSIHPGLEKVGSCDPHFQVEPIHTEEQDICMHLFEIVLCQWSD